MLASQLSRSYTGHNLFVHMQHLWLHLTRNRRILLLLILVVAGGSFLAGVFSFQRWQGRQYFGRVERMTGSGFILSDPRLGERMVGTDPATVTKRGPRTVEAAEGLQVGENVMVIGEEVAGGIHAKVVRIVSGRGKVAPR